MNAKLLRPYFLGALILISLTLTFFILRPFLVTLALAAVFAVILRPLYHLLSKRISKSPGLAAFVTMAVTVICILIPLSFLSLQIVEEAQNLYTSLSDGSGVAYLDTVFRQANESINLYAPSLAISGFDLSVSIDQYLKDGLSWLISNIGGAFGSAAQLLLDLFVFLIALYYLLRDGEKLKQKIIEMSPLADTEDSMVLSRLDVAVTSVIRGSLVIALVQGVLTAIGFTIFGVPNSILWGVVAMFAALIPGIGTSIILIPGVIYLFIIGATVPAVGLLIWSLVAVGLIDNLLGPRLVGRGMQLHPLIVLLSVFGGLGLIGPAGLFLGPLCASLLFALLSIYQHVSKQPT